MFTPKKKAKEILVESRKTRVVSKACKTLLTKTKQIPCVAREREKEREMKPVESLTINSLDGSICTQFMWGMKSGLLVLLVLVLCTKTHKNRRKISILSSSNASKQFPARLKPLFVCSEASLIDSPKRRYWLTGISDFYLTMSWT